MLLLHVALLSAFVQAREVLDELHQWNNVWFDPSKAILKRISMYNVFRLLYGANRTFLDEELLLRQGQRFRSTKAKSFQYKPEMGADIHKREPLLGCWQYLLGLGHIPSGT